MNYRQDIQNRRLESFRNSAASKVFIDEYGVENPAVSGGVIARDGKPEWREFVFVCGVCGKEVNLMGCYYSPPSPEFCCGRFPTLTS